MTFIKFIITVFDIFLAFILGASAISENWKNEEYSALVITMFLMLCNTFMIWN